MNFQQIKCVIQAMLLQGQKARGIKSTIETLVRYTLCLSVY